MSTLAKVLIALIIVLAVAIVALYFYGRNMQAKQEAAQQQIEAAAQTTSMLIIDKKRMRLKDANLPAVIMDQAPRMTKLAKLPVVKAKVGPKVMTLLCDEKVFEDLPVKKEVKVSLSGMYITAIKGVRGGIAPKEEEKKGFFKRLMGGNKQARG